LINLAITDIKPYSKNAKKHPKRQIEQIAASIKEFGFNQPIVVDKDNTLIVGHGRVEAAKLLGLKEVPAIIASDLGKHALSVWTFNKKSDGTHPTQKPVELCSHAITHSSKTDDIVLDLFLGSGSTLIACEKTNRVCFGMELDPKYIDVIIQRWEDYTGQKAVLTN